MALGVDVLAPEGYGEVIGGGERQRISMPCSASRHACRRKRSNGISICAGMAPSRTPASAWASTRRRVDVRLEHVRETIPFPRMLYRLYP